jgi:hypothetical protein
MRSRAGFHSLTALLFAALVGTLAAPRDVLANVDEGRARMENLSRQVVDSQLAQEGEAEPASVNMFSGRTWQRVKHASWSLLIPGWSHYRANQYGRAAFFAGAEAAIWISYGVFKSQASRREETYKDFAMQFAGVRSRDHEDGYWRSVGEYLSNEDYNEVVRRDLRAGIDPEGPEYVYPDDWLWRSEVRFDEYRELRAEANDADHRADLTLTWAIINRVVSFVDALRSAPVAQENPLGLPPEGLSFDLDLDPSLRNPSTTLVLRHSF